jgi:signal transduction histidine kinase
VRPRTASRLAWSFWAVSLLSLAGSFVFGMLATSFVDEGVVIVLVPVFLMAFATVGAMIASRRPGNAIGWILCATGVLWGLASLADGYATYAASSARTDTAVARVADWVNLWFYGAATFAPVTLILLLFPEGRVPSRRWRPYVWLAAIGNLIIAVSNAVDPAVTTSDARFLKTNPFGIEGAEEFIGIVTPLAFFSAMVALIASAVAIVLQLRRARGDERQQLKWLAYAGMVNVVTFIVIMIVGSAVGWESNGVFEAVSQAAIITALTLIPVATGFAILKHRLYDIDVVIRRTALYGGLAAFVTVVYVGIVVGIGALVGSRENLLLSIVATALIAVAFQPARERARRLSDRLVYGKRASPYEVLSEFSDRLAEAYSVDDVLPRMARVLAEGTGASLVRVWLRVGPELRPVAASPADAPTMPTGSDPSQLPDRAFEVRHQGEPLGAITVATPARELLTPAQEKLVEDLASQAGLVLRNAALIADLRASRQRLVAAQDEERRKLERNLHDGAQQQLVALAVKLGLVERLVDRDASKARQMLAEAKGETGEALENLRDLARGIYPPLLADKGLAAALEAQARRSPVPVVVEPDGIGRYPQDAEAAVYFCCLEALQNVGKYAGASSVAIRLGHVAGELTFEVADDGVGFDALVGSYGTGLQGMDDRLSAIGGSLEVRSAPGAGTTVAGRVPAGEVQT